MEDKIVLIIIMTFPIVLLLILGFVFINGKGSSLIAGYNTMPQEKKETYDTVALCKFIGKMMFALAFSMFFWVLSIAYEINSLFVFGLILFLALLVLSLIYINTGNRFNK